jgi:hypothetical protein
MVKMKEFIKQAYAYTEALSFFQDISKENLLELYTELDCIYSLFESQGIVCRYSKNQILKDFDLVEGLGDIKYLKVEGSDKLIDIPINVMIGELTKVFTNCI